MRTLNGTRFNLLSDEERQQITTWMASHNLDPESTRHLRWEPNTPTILAETYTPDPTNARRWQMNEAGTEVLTTYTPLPIAGFPLLVFTNWRFEES